MVFSERLSEKGIVNIPNFISAEDAKRYKNIGIKVHQLENLKTQLMNFDKEVMDVSVSRELIHKNNSERYSVYIYLGDENCLVSLNGQSYSFTPGTLIIVESNEDLIFYNESVMLVCSFIEKSKAEKQQISLLNQIVKEGFFVFSKLIQPTSFPDGWDYYTNSNGDEKNWIYQNLFVNLSNILKVCTCKIVGVQLKTFKNYKLNNFVIEDEQIRKPYSFFCVCEGELEYKDRKLKTGDLLILSNYNEENNKLTHSFKSKHLKLLVCHLEN